MSNEYRFIIHISSSRCTECLFRAQALREKSEFLRHQGCDIEVKIGDMAFAQWLVYMPGMNALTMCDNCARSYAFNALDKGATVTAHGSAIFDMEQWPKPPVLATYLAPGNYDSRERGCICPTGHTSDQHQALFKSAIDVGLMIVNRRCPIHGLWAYACKVQE